MCCRQTGYLGAAGTSSHFNLSIDVVMNSKRKSIFATALLLAVLLGGWQILRIKLAGELKAEPGEACALGGPAISPVPSAQPAPPVAGATREAAIAATPRVEIDSPALIGSINLKGGRIDDVVLRNYNETVSPDSAKAVLLSPSGSEHPYLAVTGWLSQPDVAVPKADTLWEQEGTGPLTATHPVVLRYDNGQGLLFGRTISVDDHYMFTVADEAENKTSQPVTLTPWGQVARLSAPNSVRLRSMFARSRLIERTYASALRNYEDGMRRETFTDTGGWAGFTDGRCAVTLIPNNQVPHEIEMFGLQMAGKPDKQFYVNVAAAQPVRIEPGAKSRVAVHIFAGPKQVKILDRYGSDLGIEGFDNLIDWGWFPFITKPIARFGLSAPL